MLGLILLSYQISLNFTLAQINQFHSIQLVKSLVIMSVLIVMCLGYVIFRMYRTNKRTDRATKPKKIEIK
ncbi:hypothetical protein [Amphibacillus cookii]|uniref:hypothetical protein n=1 Tax=Amphibacillus cookii TaxID=767787 RepID=UPI001957ED5C|nr:hypothetical protein [Amphibacillus cookii]MBM7542525.1 putative membrane protein AbrB (regulator of aidB expression) [Amphibacillus cookii]